MAAVVKVNVGDVATVTTNWAPDLGSATISSSNFNPVLPGPTVTGKSNTTNSTTAQISAASCVPGFYDFGNTITTSDGQTLTKYFTVEVVAANYI